MKFKKLHFGTAGIPISTNPRNTSEGIKKVKSLGLGNMELEFVRSVNIGESTAPKVKSVSEQNNIFLTCHGQYYINLNSNEKIKIRQSIKRVLKAAHIANLCGAFSLTFHAAYYMKKDPADVFKQVKKSIKQINDELAKTQNPIQIRPETTGKPTQWGTTEEICKLSAEFDNVLSCIDFSHIFARSAGKLNSEKDYAKQLEIVEKFCGKTALHQMHIHMSGIAYGDKGERNHLILKESEFNYKAVLKVLKDFNCKGVVVCESPNIEDDALILQKYYSKL